MENIDTPTVDAAEASLAPIITDVKHFVVNEDGTRTEVSEEEVRAAFTDDGEVAREYVEQ